MWNPKRILMLVVGFVGFSVAYSIYAYFLGGMDGLPPLPSACFPPPPGTGADAAERMPERQPSVVERKLRLAFSEDCPELKRTIRLDVRDKNIVVSADTFTIENDGRVKLEPFSIAIFCKDKADGLFPEINTVQADIAYLRFDQPISSISDMASRKIVGGELIRGPKAFGVLVRSNRRTPQQLDDLTLTTEGPIFYEESRQLIWTAAPVKILDEQSRSAAGTPTTIVAIGMDVYLETEDEKPKTGKTGEPAAAKAVEKHAKKEKPAAGVSGVKAIALRSDVEMQLYVDSSSGFMATSPPKPADKTAAPGDGQKSVAVAKNQPAPKPAGKDLVHIKTQGPFYYDVLTDRARFDISQHPGERPNSVQVTRAAHGGNGAHDQLDCEHLILQFARKNATPGTGASGTSPLSDSRSSQLEIDTAHAWNDGSQLILTSDQDALLTYAQDLVYEATLRQSTLKGDPEVTVFKDGHEIRAKEMVLTSMGDKSSQAARLKGPGRINMLDSATKERTQQARFRDTLVWMKDGDKDLLDLTGDAAFEELEPNQQLQPGQQPRLKQRLQADRLKVWLEAQPGTANAGDSKRRPQKLEAIGQVAAQSPDLTVHDTERLIIWFKDAPPGSVAPPPAAGTGPARAAGTAQGATVTQPGTTAPATGTAAARPGEPEKPKRPMDLSARSVEVHVVRFDARNELEKLWCEGSVFVKQAPETKDDKGVDIRGQTLQLLRFPEGHVLTVTGNLAEVQLDKLTMMGPEVNIDQKENKAWVNGLGAMTMPSNASFRGDKLEKPTELTVHWNRDMFFNGKYALYHGGVQAEQDNARLSCQTMQVFLDRFVSLKEGASKAGQPPAKVETLVCDKNVRVEDTDRQNGRVLRYQRIESVELKFDNEEGILIAPGPGILRILQLGSKDENGPAMSVSAKPPVPAGTPGPDEEMKLTRVTFLGRMFANNTTRTAVFYDNVDVVNLPSDDPDVAVDLDKPLPERAMFLHCDQLKVYNARDPKQQPAPGTKQGMQQMEARGHATVQSKEFWGRSDTIKYDESKELIVFESNDGNLATLYRTRVRGQAPEEIKGKKIYYWRRTNDFKIEGGTGLKTIQ